MGIYEIAILGRIIWDLHSLNNEGTVGNVTEPRTLILADGRQTDGISGEMLKHIHAEYIWALEVIKVSSARLAENSGQKEEDMSKEVLLKKELKLL